MYATSSRARRWPLAFTLGTLMTAVLAACADRPTEPTFHAALTPNAAVGDPHTVTNTNDNGLGSLRWVLGYTTGGETIRFDPTLAGQTINVDSALTILNPVTIEGPAGSGMTINAGGKGRIFDPKTRGTITLRNLSLTGGNGGTASGGVMQGPPEVVLENSVVYGNKGHAYTAIDIVKLTLINSTVSGNTSTTTAASAAVFAYNETIVINSTVAHNASGGVLSARRLVLRNAVISNNGGYNCAIDTLWITREGTNLSDDDSCGGPSTVLIADPKLGPLADNGGPTMSHALLAGSPAINAGSSCTVQVDQRYAARDAQCDLGAYEFADFTAVTLTVDPTSIVKPAGWAVLTGTITCSRSESFKLALELHQEQKAGRGTTPVHAASTLPVNCDTTVRPWSASMYVTDGAFQVGSANATAQTLEAEPWIAPASVSGQVRLFNRK